MKEENLRQDARGAELKGCSETGRRFVQKEDGKKPEVCRKSVRR